MEVGAGEQVREVLGVHARTQWKRATKEREREVDGSCNALLSYIINLALVWMKCGAAAYYCY
jgi:hypothetical protein